MVGCRRCGTPVALGGKSTDDDDMNRIDSTLCLWETGEWCRGQVEGVSDDVVDEHLDAGEIGVM